LGGLVIGHASGAQLLRQGNWARLSSVWPEP
jgi:hypothetical protein